MNAWHLRLAATTLRRGGLVVHATEGVWGIACDPRNAAAISALLTLKARAADKGLIVIGSAAADFEAELDALEPGQRRCVEATWPGAVSWVLPNRDFPPWITGFRKTVVVRVPGHPQARALCRAFGGPLVSTSANRSGRPATGRRLKIRAWLTSASAEADCPLYLLPGETLGRRAPSEIRTVAGRTLRSGA